MNRIFLFLLLVALAFPTASQAAGVPVKSYAVPLNRNVAPLAIEGFAGAPISIVGTLPEGQDFTGLLSIQAELHATQSNSETPLAVSDTLEDLPAGRTVTLTFSSAKMNRVKGKYFLSIYATFAASRLEVFRVAEIRLAEGGSSQLTPPAPAPALYVTDEDFDALELRVVAVEEGGGGGGGGGGGATNLTWTASPTGGVVASSSGTDATLTLGTGVNAGLLSPAQFTKLSTLSGTNTGDQDLSGYALTSSLSGYQALDSDLTSISALATMAYGRGVLIQPDAASLRTLAGLGTLATQSGTFSGSSSGTNTGDQDLSAYLATATAASTYQPLNAKLSAFSALANGSGALTNNGSGVLTWAASGGTGTVTSASVVTANGVSGSVATATTTPAITITLGAITPTSVAASGTVTGSNLSGTNTGDQANITGNAATVTTNANLTGDVTSVGNATAIAAGVIVNADINASAAIAVTKLALPGGSTNFLREDGAWAAPAGGGAAQLVVPLTTAATTWTNMSAAVSWFGTASGYDYIQKVDLTNFTRVRFLVNKKATAGAVGSKIILRYHTVFTSTAATPVDVGVSEVSNPCDGAGNALLDSGWIDLATGAKADIFLCLVGTGGDGALDPTFGSIVAQFK